jgi:hypothetical protein
MRVAVVVVAALIGAATVAATTGAAPEPLVVHHKVEAGESWQTIASRYQISLAELNVANDRSATGTGSPRVGRIVHVPAPVPVSTTTTSVPVVSSTTTTSSVPPTTVGSTTTTVAPTTTEATSTSVVPSTTVPPSTVPTPTTTAPDTGQFSESFTGNTGKDRFRVGAFHRERDAFVPPHPDWVSDTPWSADHDTRLADCGDPTVHQHPQAARTDTVFHDAELTYVCRDHMMTTMGDVSGYSVTWFSPNQSFDDIDRVCFDASVHAGLTGDRQWWEVAVQPYHATPVISAIDWLAGTANLPSYGEVGAVVLSFGPANPPYYRISIRDSFDDGVGDADVAAFNDRAIRRAHCFTDTAAGLRFESWTRNSDGSMGTKWNDATVAGDFPAGPLEVVFKSHAYTPTKSCWQFNLPGDACASYSWHWDNVTVE